MKKISVNETYKPYILARPVVNREGIVLLYEGAEINSDQVRKLIDNEIQYIYVEDKELTEQADVVTMEAIQNESKERISDTLKKFFQDGGSEEAQNIQKEAVNIITNIISNRDVSGCMINIKHTNTDIYSHMMDVASMSTIMAIKCGFSQTQLKDVALGALLHDIGICKVTVPYINVEINRMPAADRLNYRKHVIYGYEMLHNYSWMSETAKMIVLSHHERIDGSGYPFHKPGERIQPEVRLVSICDHFSELVNGIGYENRRIIEAVEYFRTIETYYFDYDYMNCIIKNIAWYPNGSVVRTNEGEEAIVLSQNRGLPDRPVLKIIRNADGTPCKEEIIKDMTKCLTLFLTDIIE